MSLTSYAYLITGVALAACALAFVWFRAWLEAERLLDAVFAANAKLLAEHEKSRSAA